MNEKSEGAVRVFGSPQFYVQGPGALRKLADYLPRDCGRVVLVADAFVRDLLARELCNRLETAGVSVEILEFGGECTLVEIERLSKAARESKADCAIGLGGGKTIDSAKGVALTLGLPVVIAPTIASNDSPTSRVIVIYDNQHQVSEIRKLSSNPYAVVVDSAVVAAAPARFFVAGMGDALSKAFEARQCAQAGGLNFYGGVPPVCALALADACYKTIRESGAAALEGIGKQEATAEVERVIEANVLMSGLGFESGGLSIAHAMTRGLSAVPAIAGALHGEMVAYGLRVQLFLEERSESFRTDLDAFYNLVGLPRTLHDLGLADAGEQEVATIAELTCTAPYLAHFQRVLKAKDLSEAIRELETA